MVCLMHARAHVFVYVCVLALASLLSRLVSVCVIVNAGKPAVVSVVAVAVVVRVGSSGSSCVGVLHPKTNHVVANTTIWGLR